MLLRIATIMALIAVGGWGWLLARIMTPTGIYLLGRHAAVILMIEGITIVGFVSVAAAAAWRVVVAWRTGERWPVRIVSVGLFVATAGMLYTALAYRMAAFSTAF